MAMMRQQYKWYGIDTDDWTTEWGGISWTTHLVDAYLSDAVSVTTSVAWTSSGIKFLYPQHIEKTYYLEGVVEGHVTFYAQVNSCVSDYRVTVFKIHEDTTETELATTGVISVNDVFTIGNDIVYPFWIDVFEEPQQITDRERLGVKIEWDVANSSSTTMVLAHDNDSDLEDLKISIPLKLD